MSSYLNDYNAQESNCELTAHILFEAKKYNTLDSWVKHLEQTKKTIAEFIDTRSGTLPIFVVLTRGFQISFWTYYPYPDELEVTNYIGFVPINADRHFPLTGNFCQLHRAEVLGGWDA